ncbi:SDR family NAD(P)-dependent oxidoreductase [Hymenobacter guriensis]|uniref:SDR family NAD(P)-dependent oxidoreductase n=1 Tax=Hymenobacter guriensis TaxID=2793065 RepID=UPI001E572376|nr:SDR family NAD(P)-dependent oxidoreductase [Hymenobacter guriensis]
MTSQPEFIRPGYQGANKLQDKFILITGGDSGIGRAVAVQLAAKGIRVKSVAPGSLRR